MNTIDILSLPQIDFAHIYSAQKYSNRFSPEEGFIEISYIESGSLAVQFGDDVITAQKGDIICFLRNNPASVFAEASHCHHTVGVKVQWSFTNDITDGFNLPVIIPASQGTESIAEMIDGFIYRKDYYASSGGRFAAAYLQMLCQIDNLARGLYSQTYPVGKQYAHKAKKYIQEHIFEPITQTEVADFLGVSPGYLCSVFKKHEGITLMKYVNTVKLQSMKALMEKEKIYLYEAAKLYGYTDPNYVSKLYRQMFGRTITS